MTNVRDLPGLKERELVELGPCLVCGKKLFETGEVTLYLVQVSHCAVDAKALQRQVGLGMAMGSGVLAAAMGPDEDLAKIISQGRRGFVHETCAMDVGHVQLLLRSTEEAPDDE